MKTRISLEEINGFDKSYRRNLINGLSGFKSVHLLGTQNSSKQLNLALVSSVVHIGANPPLLGFIQRPASVERHTYENILETGEFTINHVPLHLYKQAHQTSARYLRDQNEFEACGFTPEFSETLAAPYVAESPIKIGLQLEETVSIQANDTILVIGKIKEIWLNQALIDEQGYLHLHDADTVLVHGLETYSKAEKLERLPYAKPK